MSIRPMFLIALLYLLTASMATAQLGQCRPAANCASADKPCVKHVTQGDTQSLKPNPAAGTAVIRVRACLGANDVCNSGVATQTLSVFGYKGREQIYFKTLSNSGDTDTGNYTKLPGLTRLAVRCNSVVGQYCKVAWQICKEQLPVKSK